MHKLVRSTQLGFGWGVFGRDVMPRRLCLLHPKQCLETNSSNNEIYFLAASGLIFIVPWNPRESVSNLV